MEKFNVGDYVVFRRDKRLPRDVYTVLAVSDVFESLKLRNNFTRSVFWHNMAEVRKVSFYQPELVRIGG